MFMQANSESVISVAEAIRDATRQCMQADNKVVVIGEGVPDPKAIFGTTRGLLEEFGESRVFDMPLSENCVTGVCMGMALSGFRPILVHQRIDFSLLSMDQIVNGAAKWLYTFNGQSPVPIVIRMVIGRGWGGGPQHTQSLQAMYASVPGLKVVMPSNPRDSKGMLISAIRDSNPVIFIEHRWLHSVKDSVSNAMFEAPLDKARIVRSGKDLTVTAFSYQVLEALQIAEEFRSIGIEIEVIDMRSARPLDISTVSRSVGKTGVLVCLDTAPRTGCLSSEIVSAVIERSWNSIKTAPLIIGCPDHPVPTSHHLANHYYPEAHQVACRMADHLNLKVEGLVGATERLRRKGPLDKPFAEFSGPF